MTFISRVFELARLRDLIAEHRAFRLPKLKRLKDQPTVNRPWIDGELEVMLDPATPPVRTAIALRTYTGLRQATFLNLHGGRATFRRPRLPERQFWGPMRGVFWALNWRNLSVQFGVLCRSISNSISSVRSSHSPIT